MINNNKNQSGSSLYVVEIKLTHSLIGLHDVEKICVAVHSLELELQHGSGTIVLLPKWLLERFLLEGTLESEEL